MTRLTMVTAHGTGAGESVSGGNQSATADENVLRAHAGSPGSTDAATGQISGTAGMDALPECVWQRAYSNPAKFVWNVNIIR